MNTTTPYEQLMSVKLDQVPVPDMSDSIWAGIETQLDAGARASVPKGRGYWYGCIGILTVAILFLIWRHYSHKSDASERTVPKESIPMIKESLPARDSTTIINKPKKKQIRVQPDLIKKDTLFKNNTSVDSTMRQDPPPVRDDKFPVRVDPSSGQNNRVQPPRIDSVNVPPAVKKHRGVRGITNDDYKISAKKDSAGKRD